MRPKRKAALGTVRETDDDEAEGALDTRVPRSSSIRASAAALVLMPVVMPVLMLLLLLLLLLLSFRGFGEKRPPFFCGGFFKSMTSLSSCTSSTEFSSWKQKRLMEWDLYVNPRFTRILRALYANMEVCDSEALEITNPKRGSGFMANRSGWLETMKEKSR